MLYSCASTSRTQSDSQSQYPSASEAVSDRSVSADLKYSDVSGVQAAIYPKEAFDGSVAVVQLRGKDLTSAKAFLGKKKFTFFPSAEGSSELIALVAIAYLEKPGKKVIKIVADSDGRKVKFELPVVVKSRKYKSEKLSVDPSKVSPPKKYLKRIMRESKQIGKIYKKEIAERFWAGPIILPVDSVITSPFGTKRVYNGQMKGFHKGVDLRAPTGTPIKAPLKGKVVMAKDLYYTGNTVILDHGYRFVTFYGHMSELKVKNGDVVEKGEVIGLSGATGRVSGPHLHWGAVLSGEKINPLDLFQVIQ